MSIDKREDVGEFYPGGKVVSTRPTVSGGNMKHEDFSDVAAMPSRFTDNMVHDKINELIGLLKGPSAAVALFLGVAAFGAGVTVQTAPKGEVYNDEQIVTNVTWSADGLATTGEVESVRVELGSVSNEVATLSNSIDFSTSNATLVATIEATETDPNVPAWAKKELSDMYANNLYQLLNRDFFSKDANINAPRKIYLTDAASSVTVGKGPTGSSYPYSVLGRNRLEVYGEDYNHVAHYRQEGIKVWPWWDDEAEDYAIFFFPTNSAGGTFALASDIPGDYANVSNAAMRAAAATNDFLRLSGGRMTGDLSVPYILPTDGSTSPQWYGDSTGIYAQHKFAIKRTDDTRAAWMDDLAAAAVAATNYTDSATNGLLRTETDPTISAWAKAASKPTYTAAEVGATTPADVTAAIREQSLGGIWDAELEVWWTPRMRNGSLTYEATTNVNLNAEN